MINHAKQMHGVKLYEGHKRSEGTWPTMSDHSPIINNQHSEGLLNSKID